MLVNELEKTFSREIFVFLWEKVRRGRVSYLEKLQNEVVSFFPVGNIGLDLGRGVYHNVLFVMSMRMD